EVDRPIALFVEPHCLERVRGRENAKTGVLENAACRFAHKGLILDEQDGATMRLVVHVGNGLHGVLRSHIGNTYVEKQSSRRTACEKYGHLGHEDRNCGKFIWAR